MKYVVLILFLIPHVCMAQHRNENLRLPEPKRFIDKVEVFAGPGLSFNYGNKFLENYKDDNVQNKRLLKVGYTFGIGIYHPVSNRIDLNARLQFEQKGRKTESNTPLTLPENRRVNDKDYTYNYLALSVGFETLLGEKKRWVFSVGGYYGKIKGIAGYEKVHVTKDGTTYEGRFKGRYFEDTGSDGGVYSITWVPGLQSFESYDVGLLLKFGYLIPVKKSHSLIFQLTDSLGLRNINKDRPYGQEEKNHSLGLTVGYVLQRPKKNNF